MGTGVTIHKFCLGLEPEWQLTNVWECFTRGRVQQEVEPNIKKQIIVVVKKVNKMGCSEDCDILLL